MCPSMADRESYTPKPKKPSSEEVTANYHANNPSKYFHHFLYKAIFVTIFLVIVPFLLPSQAPEFVNQNLHSSSWELLQLVFVGIAVSYGLFSKRNDEISDKEQNSNTKFDNAQSYVTRLLQVSSVFDDETESASVSDDNKIQTWNSQYHRGEPVVVVAKESPVLEKQNGTSSRIDEMPLLLPVRSLKSRVSEHTELETSQETNVKKGSNSLSNSNSGSKKFSNNPRKSRKGEFSGLSSLNVEENMEENVVLQSPIPWRSRSGRMEMKEDEEGLSSYSLPPSTEDFELKKIESRSIRSQSFRSSRPDSACPSPNSPKNLSPSPSFPSESQAKTVEDVVRRKIYITSSPPPAPPPPPTPFIKKSPLVKSNSSLINGDHFPEKELKRCIRSMPNDSGETEREGLSRRANSGPELRPRAQNDVSQTGKFVRTIRPIEPTMFSVKSRESDEDTINAIARGVGFTDKLMHETAPNFRRQTLTELPKAEKKENIENVIVETYDSSEAETEDDYFEENLGSSGNEVLANDNIATTDEGPDVDKKADEFIAKFREQIRLQRIESIRRSTEQQHPRKQLR
ncbi:hypothetical protein ACH5RR_040276 [Cinchona calisaya]|uniref:Hydroxyproline-rich glycoprotein family protein n=1 Tax=Cinchona calisaya TaxID=153742 RepID=A0ABD2XTP6_9GENT